jgi:hypothetical protein
MSQFKYTLPSGSTWTMNAPAGTTQAQADYIFYSQAAAGALVGVSVGQTIGGAPTAAVKFALSRLDRGTAGVDDRVILSIVNGLPTISGIPNLVNVPLTNPITQANLANTGVNNTYTAPAIGPLNSSQVQGLLAQITNFIGQPYNVMTNETGIGQYGLDCQQLEQAGYVKPGTYQQFIFDPSPLVDVVSAPGIWTGQGGINSVTNFLNSPAAQNNAMATLMSNGYGSLTATGTITPAISPSISALAGQVYTQSGLQTVSALSASTGISLSGLSLSGTPLASLASATITNPGSLASGALNSITGFTNVSSITSSLSKTITGDVGALITNSGCFGTQATSLWASSGGLGSLTSNLPSISSLTSNLPSISSLTDNIQNLDVLGKASQFAAGFSNPLTSLNNLGGVDLTSLTAGLPSLGSLSLPSLGSLTSGLPDISSLTSAIPDLGSLTSSLPSISSLGNFGSLASFPGLGSLGSLGGLFGGGGDSLVSSTQVAAGYSNTVNRATVDTAFKQILGNSKIPGATFDYPSPNSTSLNASADIAYAQNQLTTDQQAIQNLYSQPLSSTGGGFTPPADAAAAVAAANANQ